MLERLVRTLDGKVFHKARDRKYAQDAGNAKTTGSRELYFLQWCSFTFLI